MAEVSTSRVLPAEFIEAGGKTYLEDLSRAVGGYKGADLSKTYGSQFVAGQDPLQAQAQQFSNSRDWWIPTLFKVQQKQRQVLQLTETICLRINKM